MNVEKEIKKQKLAEEAERLRKLAEEMEQCLEAGVVDDLSTAPYRRRRLVERNATYSAHGGSRHPQSPSSIGRSRKDSGSPNTKNRTLSPSSLSPERADLQRVGRNIDKAKQQYEQEYGKVEADDLHWFRFRQWKVKWLKPESETSDETENE